MQEEEILLSIDSSNPREPQIVFDIPHGTERAKCNLSATSAKILVMQLMLGIEKMDVLKKARQEVDLEEKKRL